MKNHIFDLDGTIICSKHRQRLLVNGDLDLAHWIANMGNPEMVFRDKLLPMSVLWRTFQSEGNLPAVCTSRQITSADTDYLHMHGLHYSKFMSRKPNDHTGDAAYKVAHIRAHLDATGWEASATTLYDDHDGVREAVKRELGVRVFNPVPFNARAFRPALKMVA